MINHVLCTTFRSSASRNSIAHYEIDHAGTDLIHSPHFQLNNAFVLSKYLASVDSYVYREIVEFPAQSKVQGASSGIASRVLSNRVRVNIRSGNWLTVELQTLHKCSLTCSSFSQPHKLR